jgi:hypothetical protein
MVLVILLEVLVVEVEQMHHSTRQFIHLMLILLQQTVVEAQEVLDLIIAQEVLVVAFLDHQMVVVMEIVVLMELKGLTEDLGKLMIGQMLL